MKLYQLIWIVLCAVILSVSGTTLAYSYYKIKYVRTIQMDMTAQNLIGINADDDAFHFGAAFRGSCSKRSLTLKHENEYPLRAVISISGEMKDWTSISENNFVINKGEEKEINLTACMPIDAILDKKYTGITRIVLKRL